MKKLRTGRVWENFEFSRVPTAFAWCNVIAGEIEKKEQRIDVIGYKNSLQAFKANIDALKSLEIEFDISGNFDEAGLVLYCSDTKIDKEYTCESMWKDYVWSADYISFDKKNNLIVFNKGMVEPVCQRQFTFDDGSINVRAIAMEGQLDVYINDVLFISCAMETKSCIVPGLFAFSGKAEISALKVYELE